MKKLILSLVMVTGLASFACAQSPKTSDEKTEQTEQTTTDNQSEDAPKPEQDKAE